MFSRNYKSYGNSFFAKNSPRHSPILEEKPRRNKYIFGANTKIINLYTTLLFSMKRSEITIQKSDRQRLSRIRTSIKYRL